jgi:AcrR family transcriptional regulator
MSESKSRPYRGVPKEERIALRRQKLVQSGVELFGSLGYAGTSIKALCVNAGLTERSFYESFGVKEELLIASYLHGREHVLRQVQQAALAAPSDPASCNLAAVDAYFHALYADQNVARLLLFELEGVSEQTNATVRQVLDESTDLIIEVICKELPRSPGHGLNAELLASGMMGAVYQLAKVWVHGGYQIPEREMIRNAHALFLGMITIWSQT